MAAGALRAAGASSFGARVLGESRVQPPPPPLAFLVESDAFELHALSGPEPAYANLAVDWHEGACAAAPLELTQWWLHQAGYAKVAVSHWLRVQGTHRPPA
eukprot:CAMPEP_0180102554 /NCGR_PEP_ID=MMETSP0985-20121206/30235_1 /TAXON_ID=483367 /ORGANISM="non described non described, Strain CCMP 2436" /LENGTH=100 /DNA_ID=CAMNT_0022038847 /DNA_START=12 /DNA_END=311 /DNA_ORIENTATION=+